jgi:hypothetical protein
MLFAVAHQGGTEDSGYQTYSRLLGRRLLKRGINLDRVPRVRAEGSPNGWLYVWESEDEATAFAAELRQETNDTDWYVRPVAVEPSEGPLRPLQINASRQSDGWVFALEPLTRRALEKRFPNSCSHPRVFIASDQNDDFPSVQAHLRDLAHQVLPILSGLDHEQLRRFDSFRVVNPVENLELVPPSPIR